MSKPRLWGFLQDSNSGLGSNHFWKLGVKIYICDKLDDDDSDDHDDDDDDNDDNHDDNDDDSDDDSDNDNGKDTLTGFTKFHKFLNPPRPSRVLIRKLFGTDIA